MQNLKNSWVSDISSRELRIAFNIATDPHYIDPPEVHFNEDVLDAVLAELMEQKCANKFILGYWGIIKNGNS